MKHFLKGLLFLICILSTIGLSATPLNGYSEAECQEKLYLDASDLEIADNVIYIHFENDLIETNILRTDQQGCYIFESDIISMHKGLGDNQWKCPYCFLWWPMGQRCGNKNCATNKW